MGACIGGSHVSGQDNVAMAGNTHGLSDADRLGGALENFQNIVGLTQEQQEFMNSGAASHPLTRSFGLLNNATNTLLHQVRAHHHYMVYSGIHPGTSPGTLTTEMQSQTREWENMRSRVEQEISNPPRPYVMIVNPSETLDPHNLSRRIGYQT